MPESEVWRVHRAHSPSLVVNQCLGFATNQEWTSQWTDGCYSAMNRPVIWRVYKRELIPLVPPPPPTPTPLFFFFFFFLALSPSLISLVVFVDVKHHVYLLTSITRSDYTASSWRLLCFFAIFGKWLVYFDEISQCCSSFCRMQVILLLVVIIKDFTYCWKNKQISWHWHTRCLSHSLVTIAYLLSKTCSHNYYWKKWTNHWHCHSLAHDCIFIIKDLFT